MSHPLARPAITQLAVIGGATPGLDDLELAIDVLLNGMDKYLAAQAGDAQAMDVLQASMAYARTIRDASRTARAGAGGVTLHFTEGTDATQEHGWG